MDSRTVKELKKIRKAEERFRQRGEFREKFEWKAPIEERIPDKLMDSLDKAFSIAFRTVFNRGSALLDRMIDKDAIKPSDFETEGELYNATKRSAGINNSLNMVWTTAEGVALGTLGIGIPDIVLWTGMVLKGVYETASRYGYEYESTTERIFILKLLEASMYTGEQFDRLNAEIELGMVDTLSVIPNEADVEDQVELTAKAFAADMLVTKFIQSIPVVGVVGGITNPLYYNRVMKYVHLEYRKRYLLDSELKPRIEEQ